MKSLRIPEQWVGKTIEEVQAFQREEHIKEKRHLLAIIELIETLEAKGKPDLARKVEAMAMGLKRF